MTAPPEGAILGNRVVPFWAHVVAPFYLHIAIRGAGRALAPQLPGRSLGRGRHDAGRRQAPDALAACRTGRLGKRSGRRRAPAFPLKACTPEGRWPDMSKNGSMWGSRVTHSWLPRVTDSTSFLKASPKVRPVAFFQMSPLCASASHVGMPCRSTVQRVKGRVVEDTGLEPVASTMPLSRSPN